MCVYVHRNRVASSFARVTAERKHNKHKKGENVTHTIWAEKKKINDHKLSLSFIAGVQLLWEMAHCEITYVSNSFAIAYF